jgi:hypothetical protein
VSLARLRARRSRGLDPLERRRARRLAAAELMEPVTVVGSRLINLSPEGVRIEAPVPLTPESRLRLRLLVGGEKAEVEARVAGCLPMARGAARLWSVGMEFTSVPAAVRKRLSRLLSRRPRAG